MRTKASRTAGSRTSIVARKLTGSAGTGLSSLSIPQARPAGTPTSSAGPSRPTQPRGAVSLPRRSPSAPAGSATSCTSTTAQTTLSTSFRTRRPYPSTRVVSVLNSCEHVAHSCARCRTNVRGPVSAQLHQPRSDLERLELDSGEVAFGLEGCGGSHHVEPGVSEVRLAFAQVQRSRREDRPSEANLRACFLGMRIHETDHQLSVKTRAKRAQDDRRVVRIRERHERAWGAVATDEPGRRQPFTNSCRSRVDVKVLIQRHERVAVYPLPDALRRRRGQLRTRVPAALGQIAAGEEAHGSKERNGDRPAVVKDRIHPKAVAPDGEAARPALHRHKVVKEGLGARGLDP